jgi:hypothetical protein
VVAPPALDLGSVDAVQQHRQFGGAQGYARLTRRRDRPAENAVFEARKPMM